ncbi:MAG: patatin family protein [Evtepia sp.]
MNQSTCLVLQGGALRGVYTSGVLDALQNKQLAFDCVIGTSAGSMNGANFVSRQPGRCFWIDYTFADDDHFMGVKPLVKEGQVFSFSYMFGAVNDQFPFDFETFAASNARFIAVATDCDTGLPAYLEKGVSSDMVLAIQASSSMPMLSTPIELDGVRYLDGGPSMSVAVDYARQEGYDKILVVLTREKGYRKKLLTPAVIRATELRFRKNPAFLEMLLAAPDRYNELMDHIEQLEAQHKIFVIAPSEPVTVSRVERDKDKLRDLYLLGKRDAQRNFQDLQDYLSKGAVI